MVNTVEGSCTIKHTCCLVDDKIAKVPSLTVAMAMLESRLRNLVITIVPLCKLEMTETIFLLLPIFSIKKTML